MEKLDRLEWTAGFSFLSYGVRVGIRANRAAALEHVAAALPPDAQRTSAPTVERLYSLIDGGAPTAPNIRRFNLLYSDHVRIARARELPPVLDALEADLQLFVAEHAPQHLFVHAGVVGWQGKAIVIPAPSFSGKTTLVGEFVRAGATYYSDEYAVFDAQGLVHPYARPLSVRAEAHARPQRQSAETLGGARGEEPLPVGLVLISEYRAGARWQPQTLSAGQGALALMANTVAARRKPAAMLDTLERALSQARVIKSMRGEARDVVDAVLTTQPS